MNRPAAGLTGLICFPKRPAKRRFSRRGTGSDVTPS